MINDRTIIASTTLHVSTTLPDDGAGLQQGAHHRLAIAITTVLHVQSEPVHTVVSSPKLSTCGFQSNSRSQDPISNVTQKSANTALPGASNI